MNSKNIESNFLESLLNKFCKIYKINKLDIKKNDKYRFRFECFKYNYMMKYIDLPTIKTNSEWEAVLIEYRIFPHLEFLIRNAIFKLGSKWSFTVICGNLNHSSITNICSKISKNIKIIKTDYDNLNQNDYSLFLSSIDFWNLLHGKKILIYQEDSFIFKNNIEEFIEYDYIGAPWPKNTNDTPNCVGNGGISLRTKNIMINVINQISIKNTSINETTKIYMKNNNLTVCPEDVYFSLNMQKLNIGKVADFDTAFKFSTESLNNPNSFAGHNFWISDKKWVQKLQSNMKMYNYKSNNNLQEYLYFMKKSSKLNLTKTKKNAFDIDYQFYKICNNLYIENNKELSCHFNNYGMNGLIYHVKQLYNLYPSISIFYFLNNIFVLNNDKIYLLNNFIDKFLYSRSFEYFNNLTIHNIYDNLCETYSPLILLVFIGNIEIGNTLLEKIINYKNIQKFNISFCFNSKIVYDHFKNLIFKTFLYFSVFLTNEFGTDIQPTLLMYNNILKKYKFDYIVKLHTKSIQNEFNDLTNFFLNNTLTTFKKLLDKNICNCVGPNNYYLSLKDDIFNKKILTKYNSCIDVNKTFIKGTMFFTDNDTFVKVINFIKNNDYKSFIFNNLYENNSINLDFSPTHFLERLFGIIN